MLEVDKVGNKLLEQIKKIEEGIDPIMDLVHQQKELDNIIFLSGFHSLMSTLKEINSTNLKESLFLMLELTVGDFNTYIMPELFLKTTMDGNQCYTDDQERNSFISKYTLELHRKASYLEAPNSANFSNSFRVRGVITDLSKLEEISELPYKILSDKNKRIYDSTILELNLSNDLSKPHKKIKL